MEAIAPQQVRRSSDCARMNRGSASKSVNKQFLVAQIIARLDADLLRYAKAALATQAAATDEQSRAENKYDTRGLEASYLAHGQSRQVMDTKQAREQFASLLVRDFDSDEPISLGALVDLETEGDSSWYFLGPSAGGTELVYAGQEILVITPQSPLGRLLLGKRRGERIEMGTGGARLVYRVNALV
jgi:transcription elongation GreA/GreB family factor